MTQNFDNQPFEELRAGNLGVRVAASMSEVDEAQRLRYEIFYNEMGAVASPDRVASGSDADRFDGYCDHLLVLDHDRPAGSQVVGTYRLLRRSSMGDLPAFYTEGEFDISAIKKIPGEIMELGRSCVNRDYRNRVVMQLLWRGIGSYIDHYAVKLMFGCASFAGTDPTAHASTLSYLYHFHLAPEELRLRALPERYVKMDILPKESLNEKRSFVELPTLIKGYLRLGGYVGDGAVIDHDYNTTDVSIVVKTQLVTDKYVQRYSPDPQALREG